MRADPGVDCKNQDSSRPTGLPEGRDALRIGKVEALVLERVLLGSLAGIEAASGPAARRQGVRSAAQRRRPIGRQACLLAIGRHAIHLGGLRGRTALLDLPPAGHVALMLLVGFGEGMAAGTVGHEVEVLRTRRVGNRLERRPPRIDDGPGRQAFDHIGIVGGRSLDLAAQDPATQGALSADKPVDDRGV